MSGSFPNRAIFIEGGIAVAYSGSAAGGGACGADAEDARAPVATPQTDCEHFIDYHFVNRSTAMFALDNVIYTLRRR
jgi:hypothetical protein